MLVIKKIPVSIQYIIYYMPLIFFNSRDRSILVPKCKTKLKWILLLSKSVCFCFLISLFQNDTISPKPSTRVGDSTHKIDFGKSYIMSQKSLLMLFDNVEILKSLNTFFKMETKENLLTFISQKILVAWSVFVTRE